MSRILAAAAIAAALALAGCGADSSSSSSGTPQGNVGGPAMDVPVQLADCTDWEDASVEERLGTIAQISNFVGGPVGTAGGHGATLTDDQAYEVMERWCGNEYARGFRLYKLYARAAAFGGPQ